VIPGDPKMEPDPVNIYKSMCERHFSGRKAYYDVSISDDIPWRPHVYITNGNELIIDVRIGSNLPDYQLDTYRAIKNRLPKLEIYVALVSGSEYFFDIFEQCDRLGIGVFLVEGETLREVIRPKTISVERMQEGKELVIEPGKPFGNILSIKKCFRKCKSYIHWFERNLPKKSFELIYHSIEDGDIKDVKEIKLLRGLDQAIDDGFLNAFKRFEGELVNNGIDVELRVICSSKISHTVHARHIYSDNVTFVVPPLHSLLANQWDRIFAAGNGSPDFASYWTKGLDLISDWAAIAAAKKDYNEKHGLSPSAV